MTSTRFQDHPERDSVCLSLVSWATRHLSIKRVYVYGSRVRGQYRIDSDLDVAIEITPNPRDENALATWLSEKRLLSQELAPLLPWPLHLEWFDPNSLTPTVAAKMARGKYLVFDRSKSSLP